MSKTLEKLFVLIPLLPYIQIQFSDAGWMDAMCFLERQHRPEARCSVPTLLPDRTRHPSSPTPQSFEAGRQPARRLREAACLPSEESRFPAPGQRRAKRLPTGPAAFPWATVPRECRCGACQPGPSWPRGPREGAPPGATVPSGRASSRRRLPAPGSRQRRTRRPGSLWAAGGEWQAPASPSHTPVSVSPPPAAAVAGHLCAAEPSRAALPAGCRAAGEAAGGSPGYLRGRRRLAVTLGGDSRGWRRGQERRCPEPAAPRPPGGGERGGGRARLRLLRRAAPHFLSPPVALLEAPDYK